MSQIATNGDLAKIYGKATQGLDLESDEIVRYTAYLSAFFAFEKNFITDHLNGSDRTISSDNLVSKNIFLRNTTFDIVKSLFDHLS